MNSAKFQWAFGFGVAIMLAGCATKEVATHARLSPGEIFKRAQMKYASLASYRDTGKTIASVDGTTFTTTFTIRLARTNFFRIEWEEPETSSFTNKGVVWSAGEGEYMVMGDALGNDDLHKQPNRETALSGATGISGSAAATIPGTFFKMNWGNQFHGSMSNYLQLADAPVADADCYVFTSEAKGRIKTLWIGKTDYLIHQVRTVTSAEALAMVLADAAKRNPLIHPPMPRPGAAGIISTETHTDIVENPKLTPADFAR